MLFILLVVLCLRLPAYFEYSIAFRPDCPLYMVRLPIDVIEVLLQSYDYVPFMAGWEHYQLFNFYVMTILHIFVPFALLLILNISIVCVMKRNLRNIGWAFTTFVDMPKVAELLRKGGLHTNEALINRFQSPCRVPRKDEMN